MHFMLHYRGPLRSNGDSNHKHDIRSAFHPQLAQLWGRQPLLDYPNLLEPRGEEGRYSLLRPSPPFTFVPLITEEMNIVAALSILLLRPEPPGHLLTRGGDVDNRLKTLFDALSMPRHPEALPKTATPSECQTPFFCLLEDDNLVTSVSVRTEQLLEPVSDKTVVDLFIEVTTIRSRSTVGNGAFS
jgi:hypothetical protein